MLRLRQDVTHQMSAWCMTAWLFILIENSLSLPTSLRVSILITVDEIILLFRRCLIQQDCACHAGLSLHQAITAWLQLRMAFAR